MSIKRIEVFQNACIESSTGWVSQGSVSGALNCYTSDNGGFGFKIQLSEAKIHLFITKDELSGKCFWHPLLERIHSSTANWFPLQITCWDNECLIEIGDRSGDFAWTSVTKVEVSSPLFDINDQRLIREYVNGCFEFAGLMKDIISVQQSAEEGNILYFISKRYERSKALKRRAVEIHGSVCSVCGMSFSLRYGSIGDGFIHIHHIERLADTGTRLVSPVTDLIPVCPNCHSMLHRTTPPMLPEELKALMRDNND